MRRGTTPTITLVVENEDGTPLDLTGQTVEVAFLESGTDGKLLVKREDDEGVAIEADGGASVVTVHLTQEETLKFREGRSIEVQVRANVLGEAIATEITSVESERILRDGVI